MSKHDGINKIFRKAKPFLAVIFLQFGYAGMDIISKVALNRGMSNYVFIVYRHAVATIVMAPFAIVLDKNIRPKMTRPIFVKLMLLTLLEPVIGQNLYFLGMKVTTATFVVSMANVLPAVTFVMAWILRLEEVNLKSIRSQAKVIGTITTVAGAMLMTLVKGPLLELFWTKGRTNSNVVSNGVDVHHSIKGVIMITIACFSWSSFIILQAITLKSYQLSMTAGICLLGTAEGAIVALVMERGNTAVWAIKWNATLLATLYGGIVCSGVRLLHPRTNNEGKGSCFCDYIRSLNMIIVAIMGSIILAEKTYLGRVIGATVIVAGLYLVAWGKSKDTKISSLPIGEQISPEKQNVETESEEKCCDNLTIKVSDGVM